MVEPAAVPEPEWFEDESLAPAPSPLAFETWRETLDS